MLRGNYDGESKVVYDINMNYLFERNATVLPEYDISKCYYTYNSIRDYDKTRLESSEFWILGYEFQYIIVGFCKNCHDYIMPDVNGIYKKEWRENLIASGCQFLGQMSFDQLKKYIILL